MSAHLSALIAHRDLALSVVASGKGDPQLTWAHSSDLDDPTPFVESGQLLLTVGTQFPQDDIPAYYRDYVDRLVRAGVAALGFGTEVVRSGTPLPLRDACERAGLPLLEVPYFTPFIAVCRWVADEIARDALARTRWALEAQEDISLAALKGIEHAVSRAARALGASIFVLDTDAHLIHRAGPGMAARDELLTASELLLAGGRRASHRDTFDDRSSVIHTLGGGGALRGVLAVSRRTPLEDHELPLVTTLIALVEVSLENSHATRQSFRTLLEQYLGLLVEGRVDEVRRALSATPVRLPDAPFLVLAMEARRVPARFRDTVERLCFAPQSRSLVASHSDLLAVIVDRRDWEGAIGQAAQEAPHPIGVSESVGWPGLGVGISQARLALEAATADGPTRFDEVATSSFIGMVSSGPAAELARARLAPILMDDAGALLIAQARDWLAHNAQWDPAARELGLHRHTLKLRMAGLAERLGIDLDRFAGRAELWALVFTSAGIDDAPDLR